MTQKNVFLGIGVIVVALVVAVSTVFFSKDAEAPTPPADQSTGLSQTDIGEFPEGALLGSTYQKYVSGSIAAGSNQANYRNTSGRTQYVDLAVVRTTGTASTTQRITVSTSTSATVSDFTTSFPNALINFVLATSTVATTTNSVQGSGATGPGVIALADGEYLIFALTQTFAQANCSGSVCETATSTNRGFNLEVLARVLQIK